MILISNLRIKFATIALLAMALIAISIPVMATVCQYGGEQPVKDCKTADDSVCVPDTPAITDESPVCNNDNVASDCTAVDVSCTPPDDSCGAVTAAVTETYCAQTVKSCDSEVKDDQACEAAAATDKVCNGSKPKVCNGSKTTDKVCNGSKTTDKVCNGSKAITCPKATTTCTPTPHMPPCVPGMNK